MTKLWLAEWVQPSTPRPTPPPGSCSGFVGSKLPLKEYRLL